MARQLMIIFMLIFAVKAKSQQQIEISSLPKLTWENTPVSASFSSGKLTIVAGEKTDMFRDPNATYNTDNAPKLLFPADSNFVLTAALSHDFTNKWDAGALVLKADSANWVKFCFEKDYTGAKRIVSVVTKGISDDCNSVALNTSSAFLRMAKAGKVITLYYSTDGKTWLLVRHFQFESPKQLMLGFLSQSPTGKNCSVTFSSIRYETRKIEDPYTGE